MEKQDYEGKCLDKDILVQGNKIYSPDTCVFVSANLNKLLISSLIKRGDYPLGVSWHKVANKFTSSVTVLGVGKHLGYFKTPQKAHRAWQKAKLDLIFYTAQEQTDERLKSALLLRCTQLKFDLDSNLETIKL